MSKELARTHPGPVSACESEADPMPEIHALSPTPLERGQVHVRSMILCTDRLCESDGCRLAESALADIAAKIPGVSVLAGHDRRSLPVARFFRGRVVQLPEQNPLTGEATRAVRAWFYWLAETSGAEDLRLNIDGGIYRAVSLSWRYRRDRCSVCGAETGCGHAPGRRYHGVPCHRVIEAVDEVLEGSLVYKGADSAAQLAGERADCGASGGRTRASWDRAWTRLCAQALSELPRRSFRCRVAGPLADETAEILHNLGWRARVDDGRAELLWQTCGPGDACPKARTEDFAAGCARVLLVGPGERAPLAGLPAGFRLARLAALSLWNQPWWMLELEREVGA